MFLNVSRIALLGLKPRVLARRGEGRREVAGGGAGRERGSIMMAKIRGGNSGEPRRLDAKPLEPSGLT